MFSVSHFRSDCGSHPRSQCDSLPAAVLRELLAVAELVSLSRFWGFRHCLGSLCGGQGQLLAEMPGAAVLHDVG